MNAHNRAPLANVITLGAQDWGRLRAFYVALGWPLVKDDQDYCAFELRGSVLALFPIEKLAADGRGVPEPGRGGIRFTLGIMADRRDEVDALARRAEEAGGRLTKPPEDAEFFEGRSTYFADPEGNFWEVAWAPPANPIVSAARRAARDDTPATGQPPRELRGPTARSRVARGKRRAPRRER